MDTEVRSVSGNKRPAKLIDGGFVAPFEPLLSHDAADAFAVLQPPKGIDASFAMTHAHCRFVRHIGFENQVADGRVPSREIDTGRLADKAAAAVASDKIFRSQYPSIVQLDINVRVILHEARYLTAAIGLHRQFGGPVGEAAFDLGLPQRERVVVAGRAVAGVENGPGKQHDVVLFSLRYEAVGDAALVEQFDRSRMQPAGA